MVFGWGLVVIGGAMALLIGPSAKRPDGRLWPSGWAAIVVGALAVVAGVALAVTAG